MGWAFRTVGPLPNGRGSVGDGVGTNMGGGARDGCGLAGANCKFGYTRIYRLARRAIARRGRCPDNPERLETCYIKSAF